MFALSTVLHFHGLDFIFLTVIVQFKNKKIFFLNKLTIGQHSFSKENYVSLIQTQWYSKIKPSSFFFCSFLKLKPFQMYLSMALASYPECVTNTSPGFASNWPLLCMKQGIFCHKECNCPFWGSNLCSIMILYHLRHLGSHQNFFVKTFTLYHENENETNSKTA